MDIKKTAPLTLAITREVSASIARCELTHVKRTAIDLTLAKEQHREYENALISAGCELRRLPELPDCPDAVFVEDAAVVWKELAVITRPGAESRRREGDAVAQVLRPYRKLVFVREPGTLDGGDVLTVGQTVYVGRSDRTNAEGITQLRSLLEPEGYRVMEADLKGCLHLKTAVTRIGEKTLLINREWVDATIFDGFDLIDIDPEEPFAANALRIGDHLIYARAFRRTQKRLHQAGFSCSIVDASELAKAEGGVTCCSLIVEV